MQELFTSSYAIHNSPQMLEQRWALEVGGWAAGNGSLALKEEILIGFAKDDPTYLSVSPRGGRRL